MIRVLLVDDERNFADGLASLLEDCGFSCRVANNGKAALEALEDEEFDVLVTDLIMPEMGGVELLREVGRLYPSLPSIVMTAHGGESENRTVRELGAKNFVLKPVDADQLANMIENLCESSALARERDALKRKLSEHETLSGLSLAIGRSQAAKMLSEKIMAVAPTNLSVLITGESGVGKQVVAEAIHKNSQRSASAFVDAHCASFSPTLLEDELFGHEKGAYTGAVSSKKGIFEKANGGTLFLDEIGEIPLSTQVKLLKVIEEKRFTPLGSDRERESDFRLVCATNRDLENEIREGNFREDLYYRINKLALRVPPLRERSDDIALLCARFLDRFSSEYSRNVRRVSKEALSALLSYGWPGNVRELENVMETAVVMAKTDEVGLDDLPERIVCASGASATAREASDPMKEAFEKDEAEDERLQASDGMGIASSGKLGRKGESAAGGAPVARTLDPISVDIGPLSRMEAQIIRVMLERCANNKTKVAKMLGINRKTLSSKISAVENGRREQESGNGR